ncbi:MAG: hypothetical protein KDA41_11485, partial [Planctomycetales bacterium]|nr:hypothetical protein [Planctomycetales bacterium]
MLKKQLRRPQAIVTWCLVVAGALSATTAALWLRDGSSSFRAPWINGLASADDADVRVLLRRLAAQGD